jgi:phosphopantetheine adenylyltransferase
MTGVGEGRYAHLSEAREQHVWVGGGFKTFHRGDQRQLSVTR